MSEKVRKNFVFDKEILDRLQKIKRFLATGREGNYVFSKEYEIISDTKALELLINSTYESKYLEAENMKFIKCSHIVLEELEKEIPYISVVFKLLMVHLKHLSKIYLLDLRILCAGFVAHMVENKPIEKDSDVECFKMYQFIYGELVKEIADTLNTSESNSKMFIECLRFLINEVTATIAGYFYISSDEVKNWEVPDLVDCKELYKDIPINDSINVINNLLTRYKSDKENIIIE